MIDLLPAITLGKNALMEFAEEMLGVLREEEIKRREEEKKTEKGEEEKEEEEEE